MEMGIGACRDAEKEIAAADYPGIPYEVEKKWMPMPQTDIGGAWKLCTPKSVAEGGWGGFSGTAYFFGRELPQQLVVPWG
jgi:sialate O-acetylesterase